MIAKIFGLTDLEIFGLKGPIKEFQEYRHFATIKFGSIVKGNLDGSFTSKATFNKMGFTKLWIRQDGGGHRKNKYKYNGKGNLTEMETIYGFYKVRTFFKYNTKRQLIRSETYDGRGELVEKIDYIYERKNSNKETQLSLFKEFKKSSRNKIKKDRLIQEISNVNGIKTYDYSIKNELMVKRETGIPNLSDSASETRHYHCGKLRERNYESWESYTSYIPVQRGGEWDEYICPISISRIPRTIEDIPEEDYEEKIYSSVYSAKTEYEYDKDGNMTSKKWENEGSDEKNYSGFNKYKYDDYDDYNNWTGRIEYEDGKIKFVTERVLVYY